MKETIYTIPLTEAFEAKTECPFCVIHNKLEQEAISFTLGNSYMQSDFRDITNKTGFCGHHYKMLYDYGNRLGLGLILSTHYKSLYNSLDKLLNKNALPKSTFIEKLRGIQPQATTINEAIDLSINSCFICNKMEADMVRYISTFFYLYTSSSDFQQIFSQSQGFCLLHFNEVLQQAPRYLNDKQKEEFYVQSKQMLLKSIERIQGEIEWFVDKNDYANADKPWKNSKDAISRGIQKIAGVCPDIPVYKETK
ncbi:DUF6062 family protein [Candidatus Epulonipiscium viviparus]|uniref:DUF6062 family protein n=1 Tax=Candidatus Epulonipiscium viviparus TaxID=420336 RepID=UPI00016C0020|nr:DUF6062 family protein [Candidatus Epulopiscium viviparus]